MLSLVPSRHLCGISMILPAIPYRTADKPFSKRTIALKGVLLRVSPLGIHDCCMGALFQQKTSFAMVLQCSNASPGFAEDRPVLTSFGQRPCQDR